MGALSTIKTAYKIGKTAVNGANALKTGLQIKETLGDIDINSMIQQYGSMIGVNVTNFDIKELVNNQADNILARIEGGEVDPTKDITYAISNLIKGANTEVEETSADVPEQEIPEVENDIPQNPPEGASDSGSYARTLESDIANTSPSAMASDVGYDVGEPDYGEVSGNGKDHIDKSGGKQTYSDSNASNSSQKINDNYSSGLESRKTSIASEYGLDSYMTSEEDTDTTQAPSSTTRANKTRHKTHGYF